MGLDLRPDVGSNGCSYVTAGDVCTTENMSDIKHKQEMEQGINAQRARVGEMLGSIKTTLDGTANEGLVALDVNSQKITLRDGVFNRGSACIASQASQALATIETQVVRFLTEFRSGQVYIEGYTDNLPVTRPVTNFESFCTVYDDNFTLSAARAREARKFIVGNLAQAFARRVIVAGYGDLLACACVRNILNLHVELDRHFR